MLTIIKRVLTRSLASHGDDSGLDQVLSALAHRVRRSIVERLRHGPATAGELAEPHSMSLPAVSRHLRVLEEAGLVRRRVEGRVHHLELVPVALQGVDDWLARYRVFWVESLDSLAHYLETSEPTSRRPAAGSKLRSGNR